MRSPGTPRSRGSRLLRSLRALSRRLRWGAAFRRLDAIRGIGEGRRAFLLGSGPSLAAMDLSRLDGEFVCVVNMGIRAVGRQISHADMHVVSDANRYQRFAAEMEAIALQHPVPYRFISRRARAVWRGLERRSIEPFFIVPHTEKLTAMGAIPPLAEGLVSGPSVLISAAVLMEFLGFSPIYVLGCDLDYESGGKYFYEQGSLDLVHEADPIVMGRRGGMLAVNDHFAVLRAVFESRGHAILNAGLGGRLSSLPRVSFLSLFSGPLDEPSRGVGGPLSNPRE
jgi:hypothetical protein